MPVCTWSLNFVKFCRISWHFEAIHHRNFNYISNLIPKWQISVGLILGQKGKKPYLLYDVILCSEVCSETCNAKPNGNQ